MAKRKAPEAVGDDAEAVAGKPAKKRTKQKATPDPDTAPKSESAAQTPEQLANEKIRREARALLDAEEAAVAAANERNPVLPSIRADPTGAARRILDQFLSVDGIWGLIYWRETWYRYKKRLWILQSDEDIKHLLHKFSLRCRQLDSEGEVKDFAALRERISELQFQSESLASIPSEIEAPCQRDSSGDWEGVPALGKLVVPGKIVDMMTGYTQSNLSTFIPNGAQWEYDPKAKPSKAWLKFLNDLFGDKADEIEMLQDWFGYVLAGDTWAQKGLIIVGPKRAGKGIIGHVLSLVIGESMVSSPALSALGGTFGLESLIDKRMCLISDARLSNRQDIMAVIEMLLRIIACDGVNVNRKNKRSLDLKLGARVMMLSNEMPQLGDSSDAINSRFLILKLEASFYGKEDYQLLNRLKKDLPAIANWAIEGYRRLMERGAFAEPKSSSDARDEWYQENNPLSEFIEDKYEVGKGGHVEIGDLYLAYKNWCEPLDIHPGTSNVFSRRLKAMLGAQIKRVKGNDAKRFENIRIKAKNQKQENIDVNDVEDFR
jgi:putative DNA primase/helicase